MPAGLKEISLEQPAESTLRDRPKVLFVGDNRTMVNWGRGASIALGQILSKQFEFSGRITGDWFVLEMAKVGYVRTLLPTRYYKWFRRIVRNKSRWCRWYITLEKWSGARDFVHEDPAISIDNLLAVKHCHPELEEIYRQATETDALVLDGDGDIIFSTPPRRQTLFLLAMMELGIRLNKPTFLVNSMISDCPLSDRDEKTLAAARRLFACCRAVVLRDPESFEFVRQEMPEAAASYVPDSLFAWYGVYDSDISRPPVNGDFLLPHPENEEDWGKLDFSKPYICIGGGALSGSEPDRAVEAYRRLVGAIQTLGYRVCLTENDVPDSFLRRIAKERNVGIVPVNAPILLCGAVLAHARLFISGRYHPSIFASLGGTPCIFLGSHAHKMSSLSRVLQYPNSRAFSAFPSTREVEEILSLAKKYLDQGETLRAQIRTVARENGDRAGQLVENLRLQIGR